MLNFYPETVECRCAVAEHLEPGFNVRESYMSKADPGV